MENFFFETKRELNDEYVISKIAQHECAPHIHRQMEILYVLSGEYQASVNDQTAKLCKNQIAVADSFDVHKWEPNHATAFYIVIPYSALSAFIEQKNGKILSNHFILDSEVCLHIKSLAQALKQNIISPEPLITEGLTKVLLGILLQNLPLTEKSKFNKNFLVHEVLDYIEQNFMHDITLEIISERFSYSKYYFSRTFNQILGCHLETYINMIRTQNVLYLMKKKKYSVTEAVFESGFSSLPTFYRYFKTRYKCSVTQYLKKENL